MKWAALLGLLAALAGLGLAATSGALISRAALRPEVFMSLTLLTTSVRALGLGRAGLRYAERLRAHAAALAQGEVQRLHLFDQLSRFGRDLLTREQSGDVLARAGSDLDARQFYALRAQLPLVVLVGVMLGLGGWLLSLDAWLSAVVLAPLACAALGVWAARQSAARLAAQETQLARQHATSLLDALSARADGAAAHYGPALAHLSGELRDVAAQRARLTFGLSALREVAFALSVSGALWRASVLLAQGQFSGVLLAAAVLAAAAAFDALTGLSAAPGAHAQRALAEQRATALSQWQVAVPSGPLALAQLFPLALEHVSVTHAGRNVLFGVSWQWQAGERVALCGESGGGKTTLLRLLCRDLDPTTGRVTAAGLDLRGAQLPALRAHLSVHEQHAPLLSGTLHENLQMADPTLPDARWRALLDDLGLAHLPLDLWVGEGGARLSGGERARVSVARALLRPCAALLLDEPTAHLDPATEQQVLNVVARELRGRALLIVTHRAAPLVLAERRFKLSGGVLSEISLAPLHRTSSLTFPEAP